MRILLSLLLILCLTSCKGTLKKAEQDGLNKSKYQAAISTINKEATLVGEQILKQGGNAFDAAVAIQFTLAVTYPRAGNLGGGGFAVIRTSANEYNAFDFREKAPMLATTDMYLDENGNALKEKSLHGPLAGGVPGTIKGMWAIHQKYGELKWEALLQPAIELAKNGFVLGKQEATRLNQAREDFEQYNRTDFEHPFLVKEWRVGDVLKQKVLASTLQEIAELGEAAFYDGKTGSNFISDIELFGGIISREDLRKYKAVERQPIIGNFKGYEVVSMPPPSSGGVALVQLLNGVSKYPVSVWGRNSAKTIHVYTELMRRVYADRSMHLGDPDFNFIATQKLVTKDYLDQRFLGINENIKSNSVDVKPGNPTKIESFETTHFSVLDSKGNCVSMTVTLNSSYGSKVWLPSVGFFLNNEMDDFSVKAGVANQFGLVGGKFNEIKPEKRMLSSMTPTIVTKNGEPVLVIGSPGGSTIITSVFQTLMNVVEFNMSLEDAVNAPRMHHQWQPDEILLEKGWFSQSTNDSLISMGHSLSFIKRLGLMNCVSVDSNKVSSAVGDKKRYMGYSVVLEK